MDLPHEFGYGRLQVPEIPGARLKREGMVTNHPLVLVPGIITGGLKLCEGKLCALPISLEGQVLYFIQSTSVFYRIMLGFKYMIWFI